MISDIDDTLKESQILDPWAKIENAMIGRDSFWQMPELLRALHSRGAEVVYLSMAPIEIMETAHRQFLKAHQYPEGLLILPKLFKRAGHKERWIRQLIQERNPKTVILLGDNGESDPQIYSQMVELNKSRGISFFSFIRVNYSGMDQGQMLFPGQQGFVTAAEVALPLYARGMLSAYDTNQILISSMTRTGMKWKWKEKFYKAATLGLPEWVDCRFHITNLVNFYAYAPEVELLDKKILARCSYVMSE